MNLKRNYRQTQFSLIDEDTSRRSRFRIVEEEFWEYEHCVSPLLQPNQDLILDFTDFFSRRKFLLPRGYHKVILPQFAEEDFEILWEICLQKYEKIPPQINPPKNSDEKTLSKYETQLLSAKNLLFEGNLSYKQISIFTGLKKTQIGSLSKRLQTSGQILPFKNKRPSKLNEQHIEFLKSLLTQRNGCILTLSQLKEKLLEQFPTIEKISLKTIANMLQKENFTFKKVSIHVDRKNYPQNLELQKTVSKKLITVLSQDYKIIFVDETGIKLNSSPKYGWGKKGEKISVQVETSKKNYTVMAAITDEEILGCQVIEEGGTKKEDFLGFVCTVINKCIQRTLFSIIVVFLDNAPSHISPFIQNNLDEQVILLYNAPYSPMLNPIEEFFAKFKKLIKKNLIKNSSQLIHAIQYALNAFTSNDLKGYMRHVLQYVYAALNNQELL